MINCVASKGGWSAVGTVRDSLGHSATYDITVCFMLHRQPMAFASTSLTLGQGQSKLWSVSVTFNAPRVVLCVLRGVPAH